MQTIIHGFDDVLVVRAWPVFVTCSGEVDICFSGDEWSIGAVTVNWYRYGDLVETVTYTDAHPRAERIRARILQDSHRCALISEAIDEAISDRLTLSQEAAYDDARAA